MRASSRNATKQGLFCRQLRIGEGDRPAFTGFSEQVHAELQPQGPTETFCVEHFIDHCWRLKICLKIETDLFEFFRFYQDTQGDVGVAFAHDASQTNSLTRLSHYACSFERGLYKDLAELRKLQARADRPSGERSDPAAPSDSLADPKAKPTDCPAPNSGGPDQAAAITGAVSLAAVQPAGTATSSPVAPLGVLSAHVVLSDEDPTEFEHYRQSLSVEWKAHTATKAFFIDLFAATSWRLARLSRVESALFEQYGIQGNLLSAFVKDATQNDCFSKLGAYETLLRNNLSRILKELLA
jgi:hypothetical protein